MSSAAAIGAVLLTFHRQEPGATPEAARRPRCIPVNGEAGGRAARRLFVATGRTGKSASVPGDGCCRIMFIAAAVSMSPCPTDAPHGRYERWHRRAFCVASFLQP